VAHIYFRQPKDTPGHVEYTRNMAEVSIILIDARKGVIEQTYRHFYQ
jgi:sulfate adenylyltransferase subunit 1